MPVKGQYQTEKDTIKKTLSNAYQNGTIKWGRHHKERDTIKIKTLSNANHMEKETIKKILSNAN